MLIGSFWRILKTEYQINTRRRYWVDFRKNLKKWKESMKNRMIWNRSHWYNSRWSRWTIKWWA